MSSFPYSLGQHVLHCPGGVADRLYLLSCQLMFPALHIPVHRMYYEKYSPIVFYKVSKVTGILNRRGENNRNANISIPTRKMQ
jgi:hypothetical protein